MPTPITPAMITALMTGYRSDFQAGMSMAPSQYQKIAMTVPSTSKSNTYGWLGQFPQFREWIGSRVIEKMKAYGYAIVNKTFEGTVAISRDDFEDDNLGIYSPLFQEMGRAAAAQPDELVFAALRDGISAACYDGQNFFDTEHPVYPKVDMRARYREDLLRPLLAVPRSDEPDTRKLNRALTDASALIDSYLSSRYTLPLAVVPAVLVQHCCTIAFYYLCDQRASDQARDRYREALAWLKDVMNGNVPVGVDTDGAAPESGDLPQVQSDAAVFGRNQKGFI